MSYFFDALKSNSTDKFVNTHKIKDLTVKVEGGKVVVTKANGVTFVCDASATALVGNV